MTSEPQEIRVCEVEVRSWPERADLVVIDYRRAVVLAHYPLSDPRPYVVWDPKAPYQERADTALSFLEEDQSYLRAHFDAPETHLVKLHATPSVRQRIQELLADYDISLADIAFSHIRQGLAVLAAQDSERLYELLCDWYDTVERHYPAGSARSDSRSWVVRAAPGRAVHHHYLAAGIENRVDAAAEDTEAAYEIFQQLIDVDLTELTFGHLLRYVYYHRTEFAEIAPFEPRALVQAGV
jgi:hypothetical protein